MNQNKGTDGHWVYLVEPSGRVVSLQSIDATTPIMTDNCFWIKFSYSSPTDPIESVLIAQYADSNSSTPPISHLNNGVCATWDSQYVQFQVPGYPNSSVDCAYQTGTEPLIELDTFFPGHATYNSNTGRWSCPNWQRGNSNYKINIDVDGHHYFTYEDLALANPCN